MKRIKTGRVCKLIADCVYWETSKEPELYKKAVETLIHEAGKDHPLVITYLKTRQS